MIGQPDPSPVNQKVGPEYLEFKSREWEKEPLCVGCPSVSMQTGYTVTEPTIATEVSFSNSHHRMVNRFYVAAATQGHRLLGQTSFKYCHHLTKAYSDIGGFHTRNINCSAWKWHSISPHSSLAKNTHIPLAAPFLGFLHPWPIREVQS